VLKTAIKWIFGLGIGGIFIWLSFQEGRFDTLTFENMQLQGWVLSTGDYTSPTSAFDDGQTSETITPLAGWAVDLKNVLGYFLILTLIHFLRVLRWRPLLSPMEDVPFSVLNKVGGVGFMAVFLLPLRLGELVRPYLISRHTTQISFSGALGTIAIERLLDGLLVSLLLSLVLFALPSTGDGYAHIQMGALVALSVFLGGLSCLVFLWHQQGRALEKISKLLGFISPAFAQRITQMMASFLEGLQALPDPKQLLRFLLLTACYWGLNGFGVWILALGFGLEIPLSAAYAMMSCVVVGMMIPNSPGNVGTFWYFLLLPLTLYGFAVGDNQASMFGLTAYAMQLLQQTGFGLWFLMTGRVRYADLSIRESTENGTG
jgi:uncharacterized protein (TIRG00374 family)